MKQPGSGRGRLVGDTVHDGTPQVTALADAKAQDNVGAVGAGSRSPVHYRAVLVGTTAGILDRARKATE